jgi:hypothetical protein
METLTILVFNAVISFSSLIDSLMNKVIGKVNGSWYQVVGNSNSDLFPTFDTVQLLDLQTLLDLVNNLGF